MSEPSRIVDRRLHLLLIKLWAESAVAEDSIAEDSLAVGYLLSAVRSAGFRTAAIDNFIIRASDAELLEVIAQSDPLIIGFTLHSFADFENVKRLSTRIGENFPAIYQVAGGEHVTFSAKETLNELRWLNAIVLSEGERTLVELIQLLTNGMLPDMLPGAYLKTREGQLVDGGFREAIADLSMVPNPAKDLIDQAIVFNRPVSLSILTGRGCTHKCTFCTANTYLRMGGGLVWRRRSPIEVVNEIKELVSRYGKRELVQPMLQFQDVIFLGTSRRATRWAEDFVDEMRRQKLKVPFFVHSRADAVIANRHIIPELAKIGLTSVEVGLETGVQRLLDLYNKQLTVPELHEAISILRESNILYDPSGVIMFDPESTIDDLQANARFLETLEHATWDRFCTRFQAVPGTPRRHDLIKRGLIRKDTSIHDVYGYSFLDMCVGEVARKTRIYDQTVHTLNNLVHVARLRSAVQARSGSSHRSEHFRQAIRATEEFYTSSFYQLTELGRTGRLEDGFNVWLDQFLRGVKGFLLCLSHLMDGSSPTLTLATTNGAL